MTDERMPDSYEFLIPSMAKLEPEDIEALNNLFNSKNEQIASQSALIGRMKDYLTMVVYQFQFKFFCRASQ